MFALSAKLREQRRRLEMTQEDVANALGVAPQTVSKWERSETYPDITLLPALANLFDVTVDELLGMEQIREAHRIGMVYTEARAILRQGDWQSAVEVYEQALRIWPNDAGLLTDLAMALALAGEAAQLARAKELCERVLHSAAHVKVRHTARAALCYIHAKAGETEKALLCASELPHQRESREVVCEHLRHPAQWDSLLYTLSTGEALGHQT